MDTHEDLIYEVKLARLREQLKVGADQIERDEGITIESKSALDSLFDDIKKPHASTSARYCSYR